MEGFGERVRQRRKELGMTQDELAHKIGCSNRTSVWQIENEKNKPTLETMGKLAAALRVPIEYLIGKPSKDDLATKIAVDYLINDLSSDDIILIDTVRCFNQGAYDRLMAYINDLKKNPDNLLPDVEPWE